MHANRCVHLLHGTQMCIISTQGGDRGQAQRAERGRRRNLTPLFQVSPCDFSMFKRCVLLALAAAVANADVTLDVTATPAQRAQAMLGRMNITEKITMVHGWAGPYVVSCRSRGLHAPATHVTVRPYHRAMSQPTRAWAFLPST